MARRVKFLTILLLVLCGCKTRYITTEVPVVVEHTSVQHRTDIVRDTLLMRDSIWHYVQGDTCIIERWHHSVKVERVMVADTIRDTIPQVVTQRVAEVREVNVLRWWQRALMWLGGVCFIALCGTILIKISHKHA